MDLLTTSRYLYSELTENYRNPEWRAGRIREYVQLPFHKVVGDMGATNVMEEDWDNLIVLDACRADLFEEAIDLNSFDSYTRTKSLGSATPEWTEKTFAGESFGDTVYVTSNPYTRLLAGDSFHELVDTTIDHFDPDVETVHADAVTDAALDAADRHQDKRLVAHYIQPHYPFVGSDTFVGAGFDPERIQNHDFRSKKLHPWRALERGHVTFDEIWSSYRDNLEYTYAEVERLLSFLSGKTVITSDHGNMVGERGWPIPIREFGHPKNLRYGGLVNVPWAIVDSDDRRDVVNDGTNPAPDPNMEAVNDRLRKLGYME